MGTFDPLEYGHFQGLQNVSEEDATKRHLRKLLNDIMAAVASLSGLEYQGAWDAASNLPPLSSGVGNPGYFYVVSIAGSTDLDGETNWQVGDWAIFNGVTGAWERMDRPDFEVIKAATYAAQERSGFPNRADSVISRTDSTPDRTLTVTPAVSSFDFYIIDRRFAKDVQQSVVWPDTEGIHWFWFDATGTLVTSQTPPDTVFQDGALVTFLYWDATNKRSIRFADERHGLAMSGVTHRYLHETVGARWDSGLGQTLSAPADSDGSADSHAQFSLAGGEIWDEDLEHNIINGSPQTLSPQAWLPIFYRLGPSGAWRMADADTFPLLYNGKPAGYAGALPPWNQFTGGAWQLTPNGSNNFILMHYFATNDADEPIIGIVGQATYGNVIAARNGAQTELNNLLLGGLPGPEMLPLYTDIFHTNTGYTNTPKARIRSTGEGDFVDWRSKGALAPAEGSGVDLHAYTHEPGGTDPVTIPPKQTTVSNSALVTSSSLTDVLIPAMTITPGAGKYLVLFSASAAQDNDHDWYLSLYANGVQITDSERHIDKMGDRAAAHAIHAIVTIADAQAIEARWRSSNGDTMSAEGRCLTVMAVQ